MENNYSVYIHTTPSGKVYVGITRRPPEVRWKNGTGYGNSKHFNSAIKKYGWENIKHEVLMIGLSKEEACEAEKRLINKYKSYNPMYGYNATFGGNEGLVITPETRKKISEATKRRVHTKEYKERASEWMRNRVVSEETRRKISEAGRKRHDQWSARKREKIMEGLNRYFSDPVVKAHMVQKGKELAKYGYEKSKPVIQYTLDGEIVAKYPSMKEAWRKTGIRDGNISRCCKGELKTTGGYIWRCAD